MNNKAREIIKKREKKNGEGKVKPGSKTSHNMYIPIEFLDLWIVLRPSWSVGSTHTKTGIYTVEPPIRDPLR